MHAMDEKKTETDAGIKMTYGEISQAGDALTTLLDMPLPAPALLRVMAILRATEGPLQDVGKVRQQVIEKHARQNGDGMATDDAGAPLFDDGELEAANAELTAASMTEVTLSVEPLRMDDLSGAECQIKPVTLLQMGKLFVMR